MFNCVQQLRNGILRCVCFSLDVLSTQQAGVLLSNCNYGALGGEKALQIETQGHTVAYRRSL